ncbi:MAG: PAS domain S-box protein [Deltaproteobacteria bacterium]|nr:PAS domain S-box protein [Deltaproteobacteria bacterium]MBW2661477.1 PAS domain S-box protein [Deltaproteobacteria bacterium]
MDSQNRFKLIGAVLIIAWSISIFCFILTLMTGMGLSYAGHNNFVWIQSLGIFTLFIGMGSALCYSRWRFLGFQNQISGQSKEIKQCEERYRILVESAEDFIFTVDNSGCFRSLNNFTAAFFGGVPSQFTGRPLSNLFSQEIAEKQLKLIKSVFQFGKSMRDEFMLTRGEYQIWLSANFMPRKDENGKVISVLCIARDITESKKLENQLVNTEKLASMGTLAAGVAHEINNPLGIILGFTDLLLEKADKNSQLCQDLKTIERHGLHCKAVVENLLSFARQGEGQYAYCDINEAIKDIVNVVDHSLQMNDIELRLDMASGLPNVEGDSRQMQQVLLNLINNAVAAMPQNGRLEIKTILDAKCEKIIIVVHDNGHGIPKKYIDKIFDPFFTTKSEGEGTGLGLFVSYGIISKYKGTITCESSAVETSEKSKGTTFTLALRAKKEDKT